MAPLVRVVNSRKVQDLTIHGFFIEPFDIPGDQDIRVTLNINLNKIMAGGPGPVPRLPVWGDEGY